MARKWTLQVVEILRNQTFNPLDALLAGLLCGIYPARVLASSAACLLRLQWSRSCKIWHTIEHTGVAVIGHILIVTKSESELCNSKPIMALQAA